MIADFFFTNRKLKKIKSQILDLEESVLILAEEIKNGNNSSPKNLLGGLEEIRKSEDKYLKVVQKHNNERVLGVMNSSHYDNKTIKSDGDLIPTNLTKDEREVLEMFYDRTNEK
jgi:hypothetical protein